MMWSQNGVGSGESLPRQGSLYGLTLNEVECRLGEPLHSMSLDHLLKSVFVAETKQLLSLDLDDASGLQWQGNIAKKTVDQVWKDIQQGEPNSSVERQPTLGETRLEDFLMKARAVAERAAISNAAMAPVALAETTDFLRRPHWLNYQQMRLEGHGTMGGCERRNVGAVLPHVSGRKRGVCNDVANVLVERRQKRMIKNRESASRSRARKQAYTNELECKVLCLEEENKRLRKQQELEKIAYASPVSEPKSGLRKTSSALF